MNEWMDNHREFRKNILLIGQYLMASMRKELYEQKHINTGKLDSSFTMSETETLDSIVLEIYANESSEVLETGTTAKNILFTLSRSGTSKKSEYINGLIRWVSTKFGVGGLEAKKIAFAIARVQSQYGMPTPNSRALHQDSQRIHWLTRTINRESPKMDKMLDKAFEAFVSTAIISMFDATQRVVNSVK